MKKRRHRPIKLSGPTRFETARAEARALSHLKVSCLRHKIDEAQDQINAELAKPKNQRHGTTEALEAAEMSLEIDFTEQSLKRPMTRLEIEAHEAGMDMLNDMKEKAKKSTRKKIYQTIVAIDAE